MSTPFGGHPTFADYREWASGEGCKIQSGVVTTDDGEMIVTTMITAPSGKYLVDVGTEQHDFLVPSTIGRFDRRLGLKSPFFSLP